MPPSRLGLLDDRVAAAPAVPRLVATLADADWQVRRNVVWALGETGDATPCSRRCRARLTDAHPRVRATAAHALGDLDDVRAVDALIGALKDEDPEVREMVAWALGELEQARAVPGLVSRAWGRRLASACQGGLGARRDRERGGGRTGWPRRCATSTRACATWRRGPWAKSAARRPSMPWSAALKDPSWEVRAKAAWALGEIGDRRAADPLAASMKDTHPQVRKMAAWALAETLGELRAGNLEWTDRRQ